MLSEFIKLFVRHGLKFDFSDAAKTSVFSVFPLPSLVELSFADLPIKLQQTGIAPCKIPFGNPNYIVAHVAKLEDKFRLRAKAFQALWPAFLKLKPLLSRTRIGVYESYLNILRLSLLSMSSYTLRSIPPSFSAPYASIATALSIDLIESIFPPMSSLIGSAIATATPAFPSLMRISQRIMQLPLSLGGLSLRLPESLVHIAYAAACGECIPHLVFMAKRLGFEFSNSLIFELDDAQSDVTFQIMGYEKRLPGSFPCFERSPDRLDPTPLQEGLTTLFNHAEIISIQEELKSSPLFALAFAARIDVRQQHCSWVFNPKARVNLNIASLSDEDFSRAIQIAILRPITLPRQCDCGAIIDPVGLHFLHCKLVHFGYLHDCVKHAIAVTIRSFQHRDLAPLSVLTEVKVNRFYGLRYPAPEGAELEADIVLVLEMFRSKFVSLLMSVQCWREISMRI